MDNSYKIPQTAGDKEENSDSQKLQHSEVDQTRRKSHADDSATVKMLTQYNRTGVRWGKPTEVLSKCIVHPEISDIFFNLFQSVRSSKEYVKH